MALAQSDAGRHLAILFVYKATCEALIVSARDMTAKERRPYGKNKLPVFESLEVLTDFFDKNDLGDYWQAMPEVEFGIKIAKKTPLVAIDEALAERTKVAREKHISPEALIRV